jgi:hypothetical protein
MRWLTWLALAFCLPVLAQQGTPKPATYRWALQCIHVQGKTIQNYYDPATDRRPERPLALPEGGTILSVFPDDRPFTLNDTKGHEIKFERGKQAVGKQIYPGVWSVFTPNPGGIAVFIK